MPTYKITSDSDQRFFDMTCSPAVRVQERWRAEAASTEQKGVHNYTFSGRLLCSQIQTKFINRDY